MARGRKAAETRAVLVKPGDVLLIGNVGETDPDSLRGLNVFWEELGIRVAVFEGDIDIDAVAGGSG